MKEIIPIKKDILFKTIIGSITNINLDHDYKIKDNIIEGNIILSGSYKMTEASVLEEDFNFKIPFGVSISKKVNKDSIKIDIDDFKYEINKDILNTQIDLLFTCEEESLEENIELENPIETKPIEEETSVEEKIDIDNSISNITNNIINNDVKYYTYKIYIVKENDTIDSICLKNNINVDILKEYNDLTSINEGDKLIVPDLNG